MSKIKEIAIGGRSFTLQSVSPSWYYDNHDKYGRGKNTKKYMDELIRNVVVQPSEVGTQGIQYFDEQFDLNTPEELVTEIENFLREGTGSTGS